MIGVLKLDSASAVAEEPAEEPSEAAESRYSGATISMGPGLLLLLSFPAVAAGVVVEVMTV